MKWLAISLFVALLVLQHRIWVSDAGVRELHRLETSVAAQQAANEGLVERNKQLAAEVHDLKSGMSALEERARSELGMIADHETFFQVVRSQPRGYLQPQTRTADAH